MSTAGVVVYKIKPDGALEGRWTHPALHGGMATERAWGGTPGKLASSYSVEIYGAGKEKIFQGSLTVGQIGEAYTLTWSGIQLLPKEGMTSFTGIGIVENGDTLVASFQEVDARREVDAREEIERANARFAVAYAMGDAGAVAAMYTNSAELFPPNSPIVNDSASIERYWKAAMESGVKKVRLTTREVETFDQTAIETGSAILSGESDAIIDHGKYVTVWKHVDGVWKLHRDCWNSSDPAKH